MRAAGTAYAPGGTRPFARFAAVATPVGLALYGLLYYPYRSENLVVRCLQAYLRLLAAAAAAVLSPFDASVAAHGARVDGRFPLEIVLDCSAIDAQALFVAAALAFPVAWRRRAIGAAVGVAAIGAVNLLRIVCLYVAGVRWPRAFHVLHEEVLQFALVALAAAVFAAWAMWARRVTATDGAPATPAPRPSPPAPRSDPPAA